MSDFPPPDTSVTPQFLSTVSVQSAFPVMAALGMSSNPATLTWVANLAQFVPINLPWPYPVRRFWWHNGSTITTSNADVGVYGWDGKKIFTTGSTALTAGTQYVDITDILLPAGRYYLAYNCDNTTSRSRGYTTGTTILLRQAGVLQQAVGSVTLPADMSSAGAASQALYEVMGITRTSTGF